MEQQDQARSEHEYREKGREAGAAHPETGELHLNRQLIDHVARLARLAPDDAERSALQEELGRILSHFRRIALIDTESTEPVHHPQELQNRLRPDVTAASMERDQLLAPAGRQKDGCLLAPRTVE